MRMLVAGIGNIFLGDDGFGVEVVRRLAGRPLPDGVRVADYGTGGMRLAYDLLDGYQTTVLVDATPRGGEPGTVYLIELEPRSASGTRPPARTGRCVDAHGMHPEAVLGLLAELGGDPGRVLVVGCEPADTEDRIGLSAPVSRAVDEAVRLVTELIDSESSNTAARVRPAPPTHASGAEAASGTAGTPAKG